MPKQHGARPADSTGLHDAAPSTYADLGVKKHRAIGMQPRAGLGPQAFREILPARRSVAQPRGAVSR